MTEITREWIAKREELEQAALRGPWSAGQLEGVDYGSVLGPTIERDGCAVTPVLVDDLSRYEGTAEFIADARTSLPAAVAALKAVLELHVPDGEAMCWSCDYGTAHPCPTARAVEAALRGES